MEIMEYGVITEQILVLAILVIVGVIATSLKIITPPVKDGLAAIIFNITLPALIFSGISKIEVTSNLLASSIFAIGAIILTMLFMTLLGFLTARLLKLPGPSASVHIAHTMFGNIVYLGFPLINSLFPGGEALYYAILFHLVSSFIMWTFGIYLLGRNNHQNNPGGVKNLLNLNTIAFFTGFLLLLLKIHIPGFIAKPLSGLGNTTIYLSMLYIGAMLYAIDWKKALVVRSIYVLSFNKLILIPVVSLGILMLLAYLFSFEPEYRLFGVIVLESGMPAMANIVVLARIYKADDELATQNVFLSTLLSLVTLPFIFFIVNLVLQSW